MAIFSNFKTNDFVCLFTLIFAGSSCTSLRYHQPRKAEIGSVIETKEMGLNQQIQSPTSVEALNFIQRHREPRLKLDDNDYAYLQKIYPPQTGTPEEAAFAVAVSKHALYGDLNKKLVHQERSNRITSFSSNDNNSSSSISERSVEQVSNSVNFNFVQALEHNMILRSHDFSALAVHTAKNTTNSQGFQDSIKNIISQRAQVWGKINSESITAPQQPEMIMSSPNFSDQILSSTNQLDLTGDIQTTNESELNVTASELNPELSQLREVNNTLNQTDALASQGKYKEGER